MVYCAVLTDAVWFNACPRPIITGTCAVSIQYVTIVTSIGGSCTYEVLSSCWVIGNTAISNGQIWTAVS